MGTAKARSLCWGGNPGPLTSSSPSAAKHPSTASSQDAGLFQTPLPHTRQTDGREGLASPTGTSQVPDDEEGQAPPELGQQLLIPR